jgi:GWxTD domain-containing protein
MRQLAVSILLLTVLAVPAFGSVAEVQSGLAEARKLIDARQYRQAVDLLDTAGKGAAQLDEADRNAALGVVQFYSALAQFGLGNNDKTREHLEEFLELSPGARINDPSRYPKRFVATFEDVVARVNRNVVTFDRFYPGFAEESPVSVETPVDDSTWGHSPALELLGSREERREWENILPIPDRRKFIADFWQRRDPTPETPRNERRESFERRVAFADATFGSEGTRGAYTDRGRVFILLGAPSMVQRRPLMNRDNVRVLNEMVDGTMELWVYAQEQLLINIPKRAVQYRFVTQKGIGVGVLQRTEEAYATRVLAAAGEATVVKK